MVRTLANYKQGAILILLVLGLSACANTAPHDYGAEPTLGPAITLYRDHPVVTSDIGVLGTVQTTAQASAPDELAYESPQTDTPRGFASLVLFGLVSGAIMAFVIAYGARSSELATRRVK